jgi:hypothetical protein
MGRTNKHATTMKTALITVLLFYTPQAVPEAEFNQWWDAYHFGAPCSTKTDIEEGTCDVDILSKPRIVKGTKNARRHHRKHNLVH